MIIPFSKISSSSLIVLYSSGHDIDWPDTLKKETGIYTYYGDNRAPGKELHDTPNKGKSQKEAMKGYAAIHKFMMAHPAFQTKTVTDPTVAKNQ